MIRSTFVSLALLALALGPAVVRTIQAPFKRHIAEGPPGTPGR